MRTLMLKRFEGLVRRSAFVVGVVLDEEETKMEIMVDPVRASCALTHTLKILFMLQEHSGDGGARAAPTSSAFFLPFFLFSVVQRAETCWAGVGVTQTEVEAAGTAVCHFHAGELSSSPDGNAACHH